MINRALPGISTYIRVVLKKEKLSEEAESIRARYEVSLASLEQQGTAATGLSQRPVSIIGDDDSGYFSGNKRGEPASHCLYSVLAVSWVTDCGRLLSPALACLRRRAFLSYNKSLSPAQLSNCQTHLHYQLLACSSN